MAEPLVPLGEIVATHGLLGWLKFNPFNPDTKALVAGSAVFIERNRTHSAHELEASSPHKHQLLIKLRDVNTIDDAARYIGSTLAVAETALDALPSGAYYHYQVIGFEVLDVKGGPIGKIVSIMSTPGGDLYVVRSADKEYLIPAVKEIVERVDFTSRTITVNLPEGLLDL
jgi:16S rRNA processing protein RimM